MHYFIVFKAFKALSLYYFTYLSCLSKKPNKPKNPIKPKKPIKRTGLGFFFTKKTGFLNPVSSVRDSVLIRDSLFAIDGFSMLREVCIYVYVSTKLSVNWQERLWPA